MVQKPEWLASLLSSDLLNPQIFSWHLTIGFWIEGVVDWVLGPINALVEWAVQIGSYIEDMLFEVREFFSDLGAKMEQVWQFFINWLDTLWSNVELWWSSKIDIVQGWIGAAIQGVKDFFQPVADLITKLDVAWDNFWTTTFPTLASKLDVEDIVKAILSDWADLLTFWGNFANDFREFFSDPFEFIFQRMTRWIDTFLRRYL
jgi:phage-related protein